LIDSIRKRLSASFSNRGATRRLKCKDGSGLRNGRCTIISTPV
jgi:hypothetical protein